MLDIFSAIIHTYNDREYEVLRKRYELLSGMVTKGYLQNQENILIRAGVNGELH